MKYFILTYTTDTKEKGSVYPQVKVLERGSHDLVLNQYNDKELPKEVRFPTFKLEYKAKLTDVLSSSVLGRSTNILASPSVVEVLSTFNLPKHQVFDTSVLNKKGERIPYIVIHQYFHSDVDYIDYQRSQYFRITGYDFTVDPYTIKGEEVDVDSWEEIINITQSKKGSICGRSIYLKESDISYDAFLLRNPNAWVINEEVADKLNEKKITGIAMVPLRPGENFCEENIVTKAQKLIL